MLWYGPGAPRVLARRRPGPAPSRKRLLVVLIITTVIIIVIIMIMIMIMIMIIIDVRSVTPITTTINICINTIQYFCLHYY